MITFIDHPFHAYSDSDAAITAESDLIAVQRATLTLVFVTLPNDGDTMRISFGSNNLNFTFKTSPNTSGYQLSNFSIGDIASSLSANAIVSKYFTVTSSSFNIILTARNFDSLALSASMPAGSTFTTVNTNGSYSVTNLAAYMQVFNAATDAYIVEFIAPYIYKNLTNVFSAIVPMDGFLPFENALPFVFDSFITITTKHVLACYVKYADAYGAPRLAEQLQKTATFYILKGSQNRLNRFDLSNDPQWPCHFFTTKELTPNQPDFLYYFSKTAFATSSLKVVATFPDGSTETQAISSQPITANSINAVACGWVQVKNFFTNQTEPASLICDVVSGASFIARRRYNIIPCFVDEEYVLFDSSLGGYETLALIPEQQEYEVEKVQIPSSDETTYDELQEGREIYQFRTPLLNEGQANYIKTLLLGKAWLISGSTLIPLSIETKKVQVKNQDTEVILTNIEFKTAKID